jgi:hypothetical protein
MVQRPCGLGDAVGFVIEDGDELGADGFAFGFGVGDAFEFARKRVEASHSRRRVGAVLSVVVRGVAWLRSPTLKAGPCGY